MSILKGEFRRGRHHAYERTNPSKSKHSSEDSGQVTLSENLLLTIENTRAKAVSLL